jgi:hypothetical protein
MPAVNNNGVKTDLMNIIIFRRGGVARYVSMSARVLGFCAALVAIVSGAGFVGGYYSAQGVAVSRSVAEVNDLQKELLTQQRILEELRGDAREELDALTLKVGQLTWMPANLISTASLHWAVRPVWRWPHRPGR